MNTDYLIMSDQMVYERLNITMPKKTKKHLEIIAEKEERSQSNMITYLIEKEFKEKGYKDKVK